jgi:hypothetical protein
MDLPQIWPFVTLRFANPIYFCDFADLQICDLGTRFNIVDLKISQIRNIIFSLHKQAHKDFADLRLD